MARTYRLPNVQEQVKDLVPESADGQQLTPDTTVLVLHRGRHVITDKFDGRDYPIHPGLTYMPYGAALHFKGRAVIPGTRNPEIGTEQSYLSIVHEHQGQLVDLETAEPALPLTDEEVERYGAAVEAIDRGALSTPGAQQTTVIRSGVVSRGGRPLGGMRPKLSLDGQATEAAAAAAESALDKPGTTVAQQDAAEAKSLRSVNKRVKAGEV